MFILFYNIHNIFENITSYWFLKKVSPLINPVEFGPCKQENKRFCETRVLEIPAKIFACNSYYHEEQCLQYIQRFVSKRTLLDSIRSSHWKFKTMRRFWDWINSELLCVCKVTAPSSWIGWRSQTSTMNHELTEGFVSKKQWFPDPSDYANTILCLANFLSFGRTSRTPKRLRWSWWSMLVRITGVCPRRDQVRLSGDTRVKPASSSRPSVAFISRVFFICGRTSFSTAQPLLRSFEMRDVGDAGCSSPFDPSHTRLHSDGNAPWTIARSLV